MKVLQGRHYNIYLRKLFQGHYLRLRVFTLTYLLSSENMDTSIIDQGLQSLHIESGTIWKALNRNIETISRTILN